MKTRCLVLVGFLVSISSMASGYEPPDGCPDCRARNAAPLNMCPAVFPNGMPEPAESAQCNVRVTTFGATTFADLAVVGGTPVGSRGIWLVLSQNGAQFWVPLPRTGLQCVETLTLPEGFDASQPHSASLLFLNENGGETMTCTPVGTGGYPLL